MFAAARLHGCKLEIRTQNDGIFKRASRLPLTRMVSPGVSALFTDDFRYLPQSTSGRGRQSWHDE